MSAPTYAASGVDIIAAEENVRRIGSHVRSTHGPQVLGSFGAFAGLFHLRDFRDPVLVASTDGVGSKLEVAIEAGTPEAHEAIGRDLVNLSVDDVLTAGARPLFFLDYVAVNKLDHDVVEALVRGMSAACRENGCALLGGETAQLPDLYQPGHYDLAGFVVGAAERDALVDGSRVQPGDRVWALSSNGLHTNGYTLARRVLRESGLRLDDRPQTLGGQSIGEALLAPHKSYFNDVWPLVQRGEAMALAHITGGGLSGNLPRVLPAHVAAEIQWGTWTVPPIFDVLQRAGALASDEMRRVFNLGLGFVLVLAEDVDPRTQCPGAFEIGRIVPRTDEPVVLLGAPA